MKAKNSFSPFLNRPIAHRGFHNGRDIPENSLPAFEKAIAKNYCIELDLQYLGDGSVIVFHDDNLKRMTESNKKIENCSLADIKDLKLGGSNERIPLFSEALKLINGKVPILIEIKNEKNVGQFESAILRILNDYNGIFAVQSFNPFSVKWFKNNAPDVLRGQISYSFHDEDFNPLKKFILKKMYLNWLSKPDFIAYDIKDLPNSRVTKIRNIGLPVLSWTVDNEEYLKWAKKYSDNIIFENISP